MLNIYTFVLLSLFGSVRAAPCTSDAPTQSVSSACATPSAGLDQGSSPSVSNTHSDNFVATTWYAGWHTDKLTPSNISWSKYTSAVYAFALPTLNSSEIRILDTDEHQISQFVDAAHNNSAKALLSIGGWTGSMYFSTSVGSEENSTDFTNAAVRLVNKYNLDGLDFDWEYPGRLGMPCNIFSAEDFNNFALFLQGLRNTTEMSNLTISAAVSITPYTSADNTTMSKFADALDYIAIMDYDVFGNTSPIVGPNAPLNDTCAPQLNNSGSAVSAVQAWTTAGFPANKIVLGVASYGHSYYINQSIAFNVSSEPSSNLSTVPGTKPIAAYPTRSNNTVVPQGDDWDENVTATQDQCGNVTSGWSGIYTFRNMIEDQNTTSLLYINGTAKEGMGFRFDECTQTPYIYDPERQVMISYDDAQSFAAKGQFIKDNSLRGFAVGSGRRL